jgi:hypothetical protein
MTKNNKDYLIAVLWFLCGNLTWKSAAYVFSNFTSLLIFPNNMLHIHYRPAFVVYSITDLIIVFLVAFLSVIRSRIEMFQHNLPVLNTLLLSITVLLIITPPVAWAGASLGINME